MPGNSTSLQHCTVPKWNKLMISMLEVRQNLNSQLMQDRHMTEINRLIQSLEDCIQAHSFEGFMRVHGRDDTDEDKARKMVEHHRRRSQAAMAKQRKSKSLPLSEAAGISGELCTQVDRQDTGTGHSNVAHPDTRISHDDVELCTQLDQIVSNAAGLLLSEAAGISGKLCTQADRQDMGTGHSNVAHPDTRISHDDVELCTQLDQILSNAAGISHANVVHQGTGNRDNAGIIRGSDDAGIIRCHNDNDARSSAAGIHIEVCECVCDSVFFVVCLRECVCERVYFFVVCLRACVRVSCVFFVACLRACVRVSFLLCVCVRVWCVSRCPIHVFNSTEATCISCEIVAF